MPLAELPFAEGALDDVARETALHATEARRIQLGDALPVLEVHDEVVVLPAAAVADAHRLVSLNEVGVLGTEPAAAVLA